MDRFVDKQNNCLLAVQMHDAYLYYRQWMAVFKYIPTYVS